MAVYDVFTPECLNDLFPIQRTNDFFDALFGDAEEGAYDIRLVVDPEESDDGELHFYFELHQRAGRCPRRMGTRRCMVAHRHYGKPLQRAAPHPAGAYPE